MSETNTRHWLTESGRMICPPRIAWRHDGGEPHPRCANCGKELVGDEAPEAG